MSIRIPALSTVAAAALLMFTAGAATAAPATYGPGPGGEIPDNNAAGVTSTIVVGDTGTVDSFTSLTIFGLTHTWIGDLVVTLSHGGVAVDIIDRVGRVTATGVGDSSNLSGDYVFALGGAGIAGAAAAGGSNYTVPADTAYAPDRNAAGGVSPLLQTLDDFAGQGVAGAWSLNVSDRAGADVGSFTGWRFTVDRADATATVPEPSSMALVLLAAGFGGLSLRRRARAAGSAAA